MRSLYSAFMFASLVALAGPAAAQSSSQSSSTPAAQGSGPQQDRQQLCDGKPCETPDQQRDMQKLHTQDMDWLDNYGPAAGGGPGNAQQRGPHGPNGDKAKGSGSGGGAGQQGPGPH